MSSSGEGNKLLRRIAEAIEAQTLALQALTESNMMLLDELTAGDGEDEADTPGTYMDGSPIQPS